ncbi:hypothetical protein [Duganella sp. HH105]|uniref:hypothetical protein n=1 Tax=Duganella sp. HH105 TaxID=1781067 RepID=UPI0008938AF8|nr:hypothetical protein [Duganella sp. HH105]OEZ63199.1 hypothetical protein DUGA6_09960 [Duganella sp. HH105]
MNIALIVTDAGPLIPDAEQILDRATAIRGPTARVAGAMASGGAEDVLNAWLD